MKASIFSWLLILLTVLDSSPLFASTSHSAEGVEYICETKLVPRGVEPESNQTSVVPKGFDTGLLIDLLRREPGSGLAKWKAKDYVLSTEEILLLQQIRPGLDSDKRHFSFGEIPLELTATDVKVREGGTQISAVFAQTLGENVQIRAELHELRIEAERSSRMFVTISGPDSVVSFMLGSAGVGGRSKIDNVTNDLVYQGRTYQFSTYKFVTLHVPEEGRSRRSPTWVSTGAGSFNVDVYVDADQSIRAVLKGYAVKR